MRLVLIQAWPCREGGVAGHSTLAGVRMAANVMPTRSLGYTEYRCPLYPLPLPQICMRLLAVLSHSADHMAEIRSHIMDCGIQISLHVGTINKAGLESEIHSVDRLYVIC